MPTPPGSTGCEIAFRLAPPVPPRPGIQVVPRPPRGSPGGSPPLLLNLGGQEVACGTTPPSKRPLRDAFPAPNTILSAQKAPAGRFSCSKYNFIRPKGPCGMLF